MLEHYYYRNTPAILGKNLYRPPNHQGPPRAEFSAKVTVCMPSVLCSSKLAYGRPAMSVYKEVCGTTKKGVYPSERGIRSIFLDIARRRTEDDTESPAHGKDHPANDP